MESTWESRDLPVLDAVVRYFDEQPEAARLTLDEAAELTHRDRMDVYRALKPLAPAFVRLQDLWGDRPDALVWGVTDEARRTVGQWRSSMMPAVSLEPEQEELLKTLVEASRNVPRGQRQEFHCLSDLNGDQILHPGIPNRKMPVYKGDIGTLASEGLLNMTGTRSFDLSSQGFRLYGELQHRSGAPAQQIEAELKRYLDSDAFQRSYPEAHRKWAEADKRLWASDSQQQLTMIGHLCREAMQEFAAALVNRYQPSGVDANKAHDVARIRLVLDQHASKLGTTLASFLDALLAYWGTVSDLVQRQEHGAQKEGIPLMWEDGRRAVFQAIIVMFEIDRALS